MKKLRHIFAIFFILFSLSISPSFSSGAGKAKNHFSQVVPNENLQFCVVNYKFSFVLNRWKEENRSHTQGFKSIDLNKIDNGCIVDLTNPDISA